MGFVGRMVAIFGVLLVLSIVVILLANWCSRRRKREVIVRRGCIDMSNLGDDELQREYELTAQRIPDCLPPAYTPRPIQDHNQNPGDGQNHCPAIGPPPVYSPRENTNSQHTLSTEVNANSSDMNGDSQGPTTFQPPPPYSSSSEVSPPQNTSLPQAAQTERAASTGNQQEINGSP